MAIEDTNRYDAPLLEQLEHFEGELQEVERRVPSAKLVRHAVGALVKPDHDVDDSALAAIIRDAHVSQRRLYDLV